MAGWTVRLRVLLLASVLVTTFATIHVPVAKAAPPAIIAWALSEDVSVGLDDWMSDVAIDFSGIYAVGQDYYAAGDREWRIEKRSLATGAIIWALSENPTTALDAALGVAVDSSGVYVVGFDTPSGDDTPGNNGRRWRIEKRSLTTGDLDTTFGTNGVITSWPGGNDQAWGVAVDASGMYVVGYYNVADKAKIRIEKRSLTTGVLITTFGTNGAVSESVSGNSDIAARVAVDASGIYIAGLDNYCQGCDTEWRLEKRDLTTGAIIWALSENISSGNDWATDVAVDASGAYFVGADQNAAGGAYELRVEKRNLATGAIIWAKSEHFSVGGGEWASGVAVDASGAYVVGYDQNTPGNKNEWRVEKRSLTTGDIVWAQSEDISSGHDHANSVAVDASGLYVVGTDQNTAGNNYECRFEKRIPVEYEAVPIPVGGYVVPVNTLAILAPYLALLGLIGVVISIVAVWKKDRN